MKLKVLCHARPYEATLNFAQKLNLISFLYSKPASAAIILSKVSVIF